ncbi:mannosyltransferase Imt3 [Schizosaccharomyces osmophilus]|uniref:Mannosyltransferase Imt3 n=1 Tax=Schizosaccharomyces osmophilus TaxID=2545709 RepID=A0AAE9WFZ1_9SCHI|nr:mannosyltransferase Imt3 [Schizosaccharomyces osmophilus]WBW74451.1 mannosyltransferase Imt3 [Schizosaccharomyces osmophilus]
MNKPALIFFSILSLIIVFTLHLFWGPIKLFFIDYRTDILQASDLPDDFTYSPIDNTTENIPRVIHQTWKTEDIPDRWKDAQQSCINLHPDFEYKLWTDEAMREFMKENYSWFLPKYDAYPFNIERADVVRYFILYHYGGIYLDLDVGCNRSMKPLLEYPAFVRKTSPSGISNNVIGIRKKHPFLLQVIRSLPSYAFNYHFPYLTVMYSTGPLFFSVVWRAWRSLPMAENWHHIWVLNSDVYTGFNHSFFNIYEGSSWHNDDAGLVFYLLRHWLLLTVLGFILFFFIIFLIFGSSLKPAARVSRSSRRAFGSPFSSKSSSPWRKIKQYVSTDENSDQQNSDAVPFMAEFDLESQTRPKSR